MKKSKKIWLTVLAVCAAVGVAGCCWAAFSHDAYAATARRYIKQAAAFVTVRTRRAEKAGLPDGCTVTNYVDGEEAAKMSLHSWQDSKRVYRGPGVTRLVNFAAGYQLDLPEGTAFDFSLSPVLVTAEGDGFSAVITRERSPYIGLDATLTAQLAELQPGRTFADGTEQYIAYYQNRFLLSPGWQAANRVTVTEQTPADGVQWLTAAADEPGELTWDTRSYLYIRGEGNSYYRVLFRYDSGDAAAIEPAVRRAAESFCGFAAYGTEKFTASYAPVLPDDWNAETVAFYNDVVSSDGVRWGVFVPDVFNEGTDVTVPALEEKLGYEFAVILGYQHMNEEPGAAFLQKNHGNGKITEYTYQITTSNNLDLFGRSPLLDTARGEHDAEIRALARAMADFGHPVLFRLCNEMNSDWTSYGGIINLEDPDIYRDVWRRFRRLFAEEGATNVIWIFNPNDNNYPPSNWNSYLAYYPGDGEVQMIGVTGYNTGTYYKDLWSEQWREFRDIYDAVESAYAPFFGGFPWIITEFASSSIGGDKAAWVQDMFAALPDYENIKIAVWFSSADYDPREGHEGEISRPYFMDDLPEVVEEFRKGLAGAPGGW